MEEMPLQGIRSVLQVCLWRLALFLSPRRQVEDFIVANLSESMETEALFAGVARAVALIQRWEPRRVPRMRRYVRRIVVGPSGGPAGSYVRALDACMLSAEHIVRDSTASVAMTLVHEATHARIECAGVPYAMPIRARIEALCMKEEIEFGALVPGAEGLLAEANRALESSWWENEHELAAREGQLRALGMPAWMRRPRGKRKS
jgi:hypothetical protein